MKKAIVLLGYRNSGKDSVCKELQNKVKGVVNAKFGGFNKSLVSDLLEVPVSWLEDKEWRTQDYLHGVTPLELLDALFVYSETSEKFQQKIDEACLGTLTDDQIPVFTDIRRMRELRKVFEKFGWGTTNVFWLDNVESSDELGDSELDDLRGEVDAYIANSDNVALADEIIKIARLEAFKLKPTLHLIHPSLQVSRTFNPNLRQMPTYEPLQPLVDKTMGFITSLGLSSDAIAPVFNAIYNELPPTMVEVADVKEDSQMRYYPGQHFRLLPKLRERANLLLHIESRAYEMNKTLDDFFTPEEITTHE